MAVATALLSVMFAGVGIPLLARGITRAGTDAAFLPTVFGLTFLLLAAIALIVNHEFRVGRWQ